MRLIRRAKSVAGILSDKVNWGGRVGKASRRRAARRSFFRPLMLEKCEDRCLLATLGIGPTGLHVAEGALATLQATLSQASTQPVTFQYRTLAGTALENTDYVGVASQSVTIPPGALFANISIQALQDIVLESGETFSVQLLSATGATLNPAATSTTVTIDNVQGGSGGSSNGPLVVALSLPSDVDEGELFTLTGTLTNAGYYQISGTINWGGTAGVGGNTFSVATNPNGSFVVNYRYVDDGPNPGNGTALDVQAITLTGTATPMSPGGSTLSVTGSTSTTIHNLAPTPVFDVYNQSPLGGPWWVASGTFQDVGLTDKGTLTIDWGDGSAPFTQADLTVGNTFSQTHQYPPAGQSYTITMTITDDDTGSATYSEAFTLDLLDLDNDADNSGAINDLDDAIEAILPGRYITVNADDDNEDEIPDKDQVGPISGEDDLEPLIIRWQAASRADINNYAGYLLTLSIDSYVSENPVARLWTTADKTGQILLGNSSNGYMKVWTIGQDTIPSTLYLEALTTGPLTPRLHLRSPSGTSLEQDAVVFTMLAVDLDVNLEIYHGQNGKVVKMADESTKGAVTVANKNDTDGDNKPDFEDNQVLESDGLLSPNGIRRGLDEVDLMRLDLHKPVGYVAGVPVTITVSNPDRIKLWTKSTKETAITLDGDKVVITDWDANTWATHATTGKKTIWVEITDYSTEVSDLSLTLKYGEKTNTVKATGIWAKRTATEYGDKDFGRDFSMWPDPWKNADSDTQKLVDIAGGGAQGNNVGTGIRQPWVDPAGNIRFYNVILFEYQVYPKNAQEYFADTVRFDATRQIQTKAWLVEADGTEALLQNKPFPDKWEQANDDTKTGPGTGLLADESMKPDENGKIYSVDVPKIQLPAAGPINSTVYAVWNAYEYIRVSTNGSKPEGDTLQGSQCSENRDWHSQITVEMLAAGWARVNDAAKKQNEIKFGHVAIGAHP